MSSFDVFEFHSSSVKWFRCDFSIRDKQSKKQISYKLIENGYVSLAVRIAQQRKSKTEKPSSKRQKQKFIEMRAGHKLQRIPALGLTYVHSVLYFMLKSININISTSFGPLLVVTVFRMEPLR